ncbi:hypothetical protein K443DRAFT_685198, partial [Laccaria amethystina LaAM-08-1]
MPSPTADALPRLPNELFDRIITFVIADSVHSICVSPGDTTWDMDVLPTLHKVSPLFRAISTEVVRKAFDMPHVKQTADPGEDAENEHSSVLQTLPKILTYLHSIGTRLRHPTDWGQVTFQNITCPTGPFVLAYMLYLSCATIRRNAMQGSVAMFQSSHAAIFAALEQNMCMCGMVVPALVTGLLEESVRVEVGLARYGLEIVRCFCELDEHADSIVVHRAATAENGLTFEIALASFEYFIARLELANIEYRRMNMAGNSESRPFELPGVLPTLRKIHGLDLVEGVEFKLVERIQALVDEWSYACPFLNPKNLI